MSFNMAGAGIEDLNVNAGGGSDELYDPGISPSKEESKDIKLNGRGVGEKKPKKTQGSDRSPRQLNSNK